MAAISTKPASNLSKDIITNTVTWECGLQQTKIVQVSPGPRMAAKMEVFCISRVYYRPTLLHNALSGVLWSILIHQRCSKTLLGLITGTIVKLTRQGYRGHLNNKIPKITKTLQV